MKRLLLLLLFCPPAFSVEVWSRFADENQQAELYMPLTVRYGAGTTWATKDFPKGVVQCTNATFVSPALPSGDPLVGTPKACWYLVKPRDFACWVDVMIPARVKTIEVNPADYEGDDNVSAWTCQLASGSYTNEIAIWSMSDIRPFLEQAVRGAFNETAAREWCKTNCIPMLPATQTKAHALMTPYLATAKVTASGTATTRAVYARNADGTRNPTAVVGQSVAVGASCAIEDRIGTTTYYLVEGNVNKAKATPPKLGKVYAACTFNAPLGVNK